VRPLDLTGDADQCPVNDIECTSYRLVAAHDRDDAPLDRRIDGADPNRSEPARADAHFASKNGRSHARAHEGPSIEFGGNGRPDIRGREPAIQKVARHVAGREQDEGLTR
jgi:hypothetical protein